MTDNNNDEQKNTMANRSTISSSNSKPTVLTDAPPPWHAILLITGVMAYCIHRLPSTLESLDEIATMETVTKRAFPTLLSVKALGWIRFCFALLIGWVTLQKVWKKPYTIRTTYLSQSKLQSATIVFSAWNKQKAFTNWCWNMLGIYCACTSIVCLMVGYDYWDPKEDAANTRSLIIRWMLRLGIISWEIAAPEALLVSSAIKYAIWDNMLRNNRDTSVLKGWHGLIQHNLNSIIALVEVGLLGTLPIRLADIVFPLLFGCCYIFFSWSTSKQWRTIGSTDTHNDHGPQFIYFFLDTTLGVQTSIALFVLLATLGLYYLLFVSFHQIIQFISSSDLNLLNLLKDYFCSRNGKDSKLDNSFCKDDDLSHSVTQIILNTWIIIILSSLVVRFRD